MSFALPVERLYETTTLLAFRHPTPTYPVHILLIPKKAVTSLLEINPQTDSDFLVDLFAGVQKLVVQLNLAEGGYRLITNGGAYQDFPYLHFHLVAG